MSYSFRRGREPPLLVEDKVGCLTFLSEEFERCGRLGPIKGAVDLTFYYLLKPAKDSSPTSFFAMAFVKSRQNLSTSENYIDFNLINRYCKSSILARVARKESAFKIATLYASCFFVAHSHILSISLFCILPLL